MVRRVKAYLAKMKVITDEEKLHELSMSCEGSSASGSIMGPGPIRKRHPSPTLSTASSASSASEGLKNTGPKFGNYITNFLTNKKKKKIIYDLLKYNIRLCITTSCTEIIITE